ncbi:hypothetical protein [Paenibacillus polymyxa]|nr:hypothetical protein [Paenibacillus polymyxa]
MVATKVRRAIESIDPNKFTMYCQFHHGFPHGACGDSSMIIGKLLLDEFEIDCDYVTGNCTIEGHESKTHVWLEYEGYKIDITADQFRDLFRITEEIVVSANHELYKYFEVKETRKISEHFPNELRTPYILIRDLIYN